MAHLVRRLNWYKNSILIIFKFMLETGLKSLKDITRIAKTMKMPDISRTEKISLLQVLLNSASGNEVGELVVKN